MQVHEISTMLYKVGFTGGGTYYRVRKVDGKPTHIAHIGGANGGEMNVVIYQKEPREAVTSLTCKTGIADTREQILELIEQLQSN